MGTMKACSNCRTIWPDDYVGTCTHCGRGMGGTQPNASSMGQDLQARYARQLRQGKAEADMEASLKGGAAYGFRIGSAGPRVNEHVHEKALEFLKPKEGAFTDE